ncbi:MAG: hypothetical protein KDJ54_07560 [Candidatus Competibacteraceae bacterium]|nr:hypothetical protein [Candidatus Competibacteraceae bacterium]
MTQSSSGPNESGCWNFKLVEPSEPGRVLEQIQARGYHQKYTGQPVTLIGMEFSRAERNLTGFEWRRTP